jgi:hypothetical protein
MKLFNFFTLNILVMAILTTVGFSINVQAQTCTPDSSLLIASSSQNCSNYSNTASGVVVNISAGGTAAGVTNNGTISSSVGSAVTLGGVGSGFITNGLINSAGSTIQGEYGIRIISGSSITGGITNAGTIQGTPGMGILLNSNSTIDTITNTGSIISSGFSGISSAGVITTLNNLQGAGNVNGALTLTSRLPTTYNIIINGPSNFGRLVVTSPSGSTTFGIYTGSTVANGTYASVLTGVTSSNLTTTSGNFGSGSWLLSNSSGSIWDLILSGYSPASTGPSAANTQQSLVNTSQPLQGTFTVLNTALTNSLTYDCQVFDKNNICISAGGRNTAVSAANGLNNTSALLIAAYRPHPNYRIGAYADQNLSVNNAGSTVNLGNNTPLVGLFGAWNERLDGTGTEVKVSAAYGQKNTTVTRSVVGTGSTASEAGNGGAPINSQGAQLTAKYGFGVVEKVIVSPYVGMRYTQNNMNGYTEGASSSVTAPLTYSALNTNATTALAGVGAQYRFIPQATAFASAGVETDTNTSNGTYSATGVAGLTPINFNANPVKTRPTATVGAYYDIEKNQRLGITGIYRQEPYQAVQTTTVMATYTVGL